MKAYKEQFVRKAGKDLNVGWLKEQWQGTSLAIQWLRLHASTAEGQGPIPDWGIKILHATQCGQFFFFFFLRQAELRRTEGKDKQGKKTQNIEAKLPHPLPPTPSQTSSSLGRR